jgi:hypothetical protein
MSLIDRSRSAWLALYRVMPGEADFNGIKVKCVAETLSIKRIQQLHSYLIDGSTSISMLNEDFATWVENGLKDLKSLVSVNGGDPLTYVQNDVHPMSAVVHLFLSPPK